MITVSNETSQTIEVAINHWGKGGNTNFISIESKENDSWDRENENGFVMAVEKDDKTNRYYVKANSAIFIYDQKVTDHTKEISPVD